MKYPVRPQETTATDSVWVNSPNEYVSVFANPFEIIISILSMFIEYGYQYTDNLPVLPLY